MRALWGRLADPAFGARPQREVAMAKGQKKSNKEIRKPKKEKSTSPPPPPTFAFSGGKKGKE